VYATEFKLTILLMNVSKDVNFGLHSKNSLHELLAANFLIVIGPVQNAIGRPMSDQYIGVLRNLVPHLLELLTSVKVKSPVEVCWLPWAAIEFHSVDYNRFIL
jgi:hypothetical protein